MLNVSNILISQNYVSQISGNSGKTTNAVISNNIVSGNISFYSDDGPLQVTNNVITGIIY